jgi:hypothetical protein
VLTDPIQKFNSLWKFHDSEDLNFGLSILTLSQNTGMQFLWAGLSAFRHILIVYFPVAGKEAMGIMSLRMYVGL